MAEGAGETACTGKKAEMSRIAVALVHSPVLNRIGESATTAVTSMDVHDFARACAFYDVAPVYLVHPAEGMHSFVHDITSYWLEGSGGERNPGRKTVFEALRLVKSLEEIIEDRDMHVWYTSANPPAENVQAAESIAEIPGEHLIVFGTGWGLDTEKLPRPTGWLSPIEGIGMVRHLSVRAALAIYMDRVRSSYRQTPQK